MATNPLLPDDTSDPAQPMRGSGYVLPRSNANITPGNRPDGDAEAANLIREKLAQIYAEEPDATQEAAEAEATTQSRSKHQQYMHELTTSGKDLATVQTEWHNYYLKLPDDEKREVWQEFYASNVVQPGAPAEQPAPTITEPTVVTSTAATDTQALAEHKHGVLGSERGRGRPSLRGARSAKDVQSALKDKVTAGGKLKAKHHLQSLGFGLGIGALVVFIFLFGFFNEVFIAPFIQPSRVDAATPVILDASTITASSTPEVIIPKINVEIPVDYSEKSTNEADIESDLEQGVVHYPTTVLPGQDGNAAFFGHSSNNIFNSGKYKFAFVLLHELVNGDTFYLTYNGKLYVYKVISKTIVSPSDVSVLGPVAGQTATATLITCDPPGTSINRLIVVGQQISPDPSTNTVSGPITTTGAATTSLPGNGPTLWTKFVDSDSGKVVLALVGIGVVAYGLRLFNKPRRY